MKGYCIIGMTVMMLNNRECKKEKNSKYNQQQVVEIQIT